MAIKRFANDNRAKLDEKIIHDEEARNEVFFKAYVTLKILIDNLEDTIARGYCYKDGTMITGITGGNALEKEINKMKTKLEILYDLFNGKECHKYRIDNHELKCEDDLELERI